MKLDLIVALDLMYECFGNTGSIRLSKSTSEVIITFQVYKGGVLYNSSVHAAHIEVLYTDHHVFNLKFQKAIAELKEKIK